MNSIIKKPWGTYQVLEEGNNYLVKNICVLPGEKLSLQSHNHRSEHWIVVKGKALVTVNENKKVYNINENVYIPKFAKHRLENLEKENLVIIEVQQGDKLIEEDIIRYEDIYNRVK